MFLTFMSVHFFQVAHVYDRAPLSVPLHSYCSFLPPMADLLSGLSENPDIVDEISRMAEDPSVVAEMQRRGLSLEAVQSVGRFRKLLQVQSTGAEDTAAGKMYRSLSETGIPVNSFEDLTTLYARWVSCQRAGRPSTCHVGKRIINVNVTIAVIAVVTAVVQLAAATVTNLSWLFNLTFF